MRGLPSKSAQRLRAALPALSLVALLLGAWEVYADSRPHQQLFLPPVHAIALALWSNAALILGNLRSTAQIVLLGLALALLLGFAAALLMHFSPLARRAAYPPIVGSQSIPIVLIAPLLVFTWGFGMAPKLLVVVLVCFFPVVVSTIDALGRIDPGQLRLLASLGASRWQRFRFAELPAALPGALSGARIAVAVAVIGTVIAETSTAGTTAGLGHEIMLDLRQVTTSTPRAWAATLVLCAFSLLLFALFGLGERHWAARRSPASREVR